MKQASIFIILLISLNVFAQESDFSNERLNQLHNDSILGTWFEIKEYNYEESDSLVIIPFWLVSDIYKIRSKLNSQKAILNDFTDIIEIYHLWVNNETDRSINLLEQFKYRYSKYSKDNLGRLFKLLLEDIYGINDSFLSELTKLIQKKVELKKQQELSNDVALSSRLPRDNDLGVIESVEFIFPPPKPSDQIQINCSCLNDFVLTEVKNILKDALYDCGISGQKFYPLDNGFAILTRIEALNEDCLQEDSYNDAKESKFSIINYFKAVFNPIYQKRRFLVLTIKDLPFKNSNTSLTMQGFERIYDIGENSLNTNRFAQIEFTEKFEVTLLIYEFSINEFGDALLKIPGDCSILNYKRNLDEKIKEACKKNILIKTATKTLSDKIVIEKTSVDSSLNEKVKVNLIYSKLSHILTNEFYEPRLEKNIVQEVILSIKGKIGNDITIDILLSNLKSELHKRYPKSFISYINNDLKYIGGRLKGIFQIED